MKDTLDFLKELTHNNNKPWFEANKPRYRAITERVNSLADDMIRHISAFDPTVAGLTYRDCTYRIYRDTRFSKDKTPYKTHIGIYICPGGKKSGYAGYYFHMEPLTADGTSLHMLTTGLYMPESVVLKSVREEILDNGDGILKAIRDAKGFTLDESNKLKRLPTGFPVDSGYDELLRLRDLYVTQNVGQEFVTGDNLAERIAAEFRKTYPLSAILNRAVRYAYEEMSGK